MYHRPRYDQMYNANTTTNSWGIFKSHYPYY